MIRHIKKIHLRKEPMNLPNSVKAKSNPGKSGIDGQVENTIKLTKNKVKCIECGFSFCNKYYLQSHVNRMHLKQKPEKKFTCSECQESFEIKSCLERHMNSIHLKIKPYNCESCPLTYATAPDLNQHIKRVHSNIRGYKCKICLKCFKSKRHLNSHVKKVHSTKYVCTECEASFDYEYAREYHMNKIHLKNRPYKCHECPKNLG